MPRRKGKQPKNLDFPSDYPLHDRRTSPPVVTGGSRISPNTRLDSGDEKGSEEHHRTQSTEALLYGSEAPRKSPTALVARRFPQKMSPTSRNGPGEFSGGMTGSEGPTPSRPEGMGGLRRGESSTSLSNLAGRQWGNSHSALRDSHVVSLIRPKQQVDTPTVEDEAEVFFPTKGANADVSQVRVEGYYNQSNVGALIPSDLPRSTLLYVLTASEGRDLIFKSVQYSLQLIICFLKTPALFSPEMLPIADSLALRFWKNYNTIRHGRSLFKLGRGLINLFTLHDVCEKLLMKYGGGCHRRLRAVRLRVLSRCLPLLRLIGREDLGEDDYILKDGSTIGGPRFSLNARVLHHRRDVDSLVQDEMYCHTAQVEGYVPQPGNNSTFGRASDTETPTTPSVPFFVKQKQETGSLKGSFSPSSLMAGSAFPLGGSQSNSQSHNNNSGTSAGGLRAGAPPSLLRPDPTTAPLLGQEPAYSDSSEDDNAQEKNNSHNNLMPLDPGSKGPSTLSYTMPNDPLHEYSANTAVTPLLRPTKPAGEEGSGSDTIDGRQSTGVMNSHTPSGLASPNLSKLRHDENSRSSVAYAGGTVSSSHWGQSAEKTVPRSFSTFSAGFDAMDHDGPHEEILNASLSPTSSNASSATGPRSASDNDGAELIPASEAAPSNWRKGPLNFNTTFMVLLGIRNLAAACRRFMRDITLISSERFFILPFVEQNRRMLHRRINYLWLIVAIIDIILNTYRLSRPGWTKYVNARQEVRYYCGCKGNENPNDTVWYANGFVVRRKLDLFFPALDLDFGAPYASTINFFEAADPVHMQPACSRCGCLYRETSSYRSQHLPEEQKPGWVQLYDAAAREHNVATHNAASRTTSTTVGKVRGPAGAAVGAAAIDTNVVEEANAPFGFLPIPHLMRRVFNYVWLLRVHPNLRSSLLVQLRYIAELFLAYKYCFGNYECNVSDAPLERILLPAGGVAGLVSAAVGLMRVVQSAPK